MNTFVLADILQAPGGIIAWIVVGLLAGWMAGVVMRGGGYGILGDVLVGLVGSCIGGFLFSFFVDGVMGFWGSILVAFLGACVLIAIVRAVSGTRRLA